MKEQFSFPHHFSGTKKYLLALGLFSSISLASCNLNEPPTVYQQIIDNIVRQETTNVDITAIDKVTQSHLAIIDSKGAFTDIDYASHAQTGWLPADHVRRLKNMVVSYVAPDSKFYGDKKLYETIVKMFNYWYDANPTSTNWWFHEIGWAQPMGLSLSLMRAGKEQVPDSLEHKILGRMKTTSKGPAQKGSQGTGANKMDIALQWIYRTCLQEDKQNLEFAIQQFFYPIKFNSGQGIQSDYSYLQHGQQLYTGGYGASVLNAFLKVAFYLENTPYADAEKNDLISKFVRYGNIPVIRGQHMLYNALGRGIARENGTDRSTLTSEIGKMQKLDPTHSDEFKAAIQRMSGEVPASYGLKPFHRHFWRADHSVHQRAGYTMDVRMASTRTLRCENGNGENLRGYFLIEGGTGIVQTGKEYSNIFPSWDWSHIPGTTTPNVDKIPLPKQWGQPGQSTFAGGVSDDVYGATTYQMIDKNFKINTSAKKSWFFFDKEVVCMGSDIQSSNTNPIHTTVNQCLLNGNVTYITKGSSSETTQTKGECAYQNLVCVNHDNISYYFPEGGNLSIKNDQQTGSWKDLSGHLSDTQISQNIFKLWFNHGIRPSKGQYIYYVVPNTATATETSQKIDDLLTINNGKIQAVYNRSLNILQVVFHEKGNLKLGNIELSSDQPCVAMLTHLDTDKIKSYVADPSYKLTEVTLKLKTPRFSESKQVKFQLKTDVHYAGSTQMQEIPASVK